MYGVSVPEDRELELMMDTNINEISFKYKCEMCMILNIQSKWRDLALAVEPEYRMKDYDVECFASGPNPSQSMWNWLGDRGMNLRELILKLKKARLERALAQLCCKEPLRLLLQPQKTLQLTEGQTLKISCEATGIPLPRYTWFCGNKELKTKKSNELIIKKVRHSQAGQYVCRVHNEDTLLGRNESLFTDWCQVTVTPSSSQPLTSDDSSDSDMDVPLLVDLAPKLPTFNLQPQDQEVKFGGEIRLKCKAEGKKSQLQYQWYKNEEKLNGQTGSSIKIVDADLTHAGQYHCTVYNGVHAEVRSTKAKVHVYERPSEEIIIASQPCDVSIEEGETVTLKVEASGPEELHYQWFNQAVAGKVVETGPSLTLKDISMIHAGPYHCYISTVTGMCKPVTSKTAMVKVTTAKSSRPIDKVALLIGNSAYNNETELPGVRHDLLAITKDFKSMGFHVLSLIDLTRLETLWIVRAFKQLFITNKVYVVVYVAGHGFLYGGDHYLLPCDAPSGAYEHPDTCVNLYVEVEQVLQAAPTTPLLYLMIFDICRDEDNTKIMLHGPSSRRLNRPVNVPNTMHVYASSRGQKVFEPSPGFAKLGSHHGIFYQYFRRVCKEPVSIQQLFSRIQREFKKNYIGKLGVNFPMLPTIEGNLIGFHSLTDPIEPQTHEDQDTRSKLIRSWKKYCQDLPAPSRNNVGGGCSLHVMFEEQLTNTVTLTLQGVGFNQVDFDVVDQPQKLTIKKPTEMNSTTYSLTIEGLQRMTEPIQMSIIMTAIHSNSQTVNIPFTITLKHLVTNLAIYSNDNGLIQIAASDTSAIRTAEEHEEPKSLESDSEPVEPNGARIYNNQTDFQINYQSLPLAQCDRDNQQFLKSCRN